MLIRSTSCDYQSSNPRGLIFFLLVIVGLIITFYKLQNDSEEEETNKIEESTGDNSDNYKCDDASNEDRANLSLPRRSKLPTLNLPSVDDFEEERLVSWGEHNFHTPIPYHTPIPGEENKKVTYRNIPIMRS